ncbi:DUF4334 domain-containing protein [Candidatus Parcubacteria bacterium]|nr:DUF4334 domain-containing protein [Candidatus Parcubacteria bacterium]
MKIFEELIKQKGKISTKELDKFFDDLEPVSVEEMLGSWHGGFFPTGSKMEILLKDFIIFRWYGKKYLNSNKVKALIFSFLGIKFNIPGGTAVLRELKFRNKISSAMIYDYLPIIDNFRKVDSNAVMGIMTIRGRERIYFYLEKENTKL